MKGINENEVDGIYLSAYDRWLKGSVGNPSTRHNTTPDGKKKEDKKAE